MNIEDLRDYCLSLPEAAEDFPFGEDTIVFKIRGKIFLLCGLDSNPLQFNVKCDPDEALELREQYPAVQPGYHMNKKHWNTVAVDGTLNLQQLRKMIVNSYKLAIKSLPKKDREGLGLD
ncbi:MmcQ/YjbR family DNA-binding protein [Filimonas effusa]|uniref:MmcQ/YjbR family DNA-binding protein n=1 Tax=Filimonas effusa TaxID=2508721 RepID=A0A4V1MA08_9BACT|nr:MmcQ/YjbR family DNA-binding protein [Filimonas effusa]RXK83524.1 MmcQ/YjbR family DNA-binding protein [Filimonas effusa]